LWAGCEEGFEDPLVVEVEGVFSSALEVSIDAEGGEGVVLARSHVGENAFEGVVQAPLGLAGG
jgi:hypothetical protein